MEVPKQEDNHASNCENLDLNVPTLGEPTYVSPLSRRGYDFVNEESRILAFAETAVLEHFAKKSETPPSFEQAGPRERLFFSPKDVTCGIVTCGGLCPGMNDVVRSIALSSIFSYGIKRILGFRYGYAGLSSRTQHEPIELTPEYVDKIHEYGGTVLGSSRGPQDTADMIDTLVRYKINILFTIGGDGTFQGASLLSSELKKRGLPISIIGVPKTIDNDLYWVTRSFGFTTAVAEARRVISAAHAEAHGTPNGIGLVKLMGRNSGFITAHTTLANPEVNFCLIPEVPFSLTGVNGLLQLLEQRLRTRNHAVVAVAEGAGQNLFLDSQDQGRDASGNIKFQDIGVLLRDEIHNYLTERGLEFSVKYIDPSYTIRSLPANALDSEYCVGLGQSAVHAGMSGRTNMFVGFWSGAYTNVPFAASVGKQRRLNTQGFQWQQVLESTGQPRQMC
jgi:6-phosphofructokinase 1